MHKTKTGKLGLLLGFLLITVMACSTVKITKPDEETGQVDAKFGKIKVVSKRFGNYFYQIELKDVERLYEDPDTLEMHVVISMKPPKGTRVKLEPPFIKSLKKDGDTDVKVISETEIAPYTLELVFNYTMEEVKKKIEEESNLILSVNRGALFFIISNRQLNDLYKGLVKKAYILDLDE